MKLLCLASPAAPVISREPSTPTKDSYAESSQACATFRTARLDLDSHLCASAASLPVIPDVLNQESRSIGICSTYLGSAVVLNLVNCWFVGVLSALVLLVTYLAYSPQSFLCTLICLNMCGNIAI